MWPISVENAIRHSASEMNGTENIMNGMRRPNRPRCRSLVVLMIGFSSTFRTQGTVTRITPRTQFGASSSLSRSGMMLGTTVSIIVKQKSPQSSHMNTHASPALE